MPTPTTRHPTYTTGVVLIKMRWSMVGGIIIGSHASTAYRGSLDAAWGCSTGPTAKSTVTMVIRSRSTATSPTVSSMLLRTRSGRLELGTWFVKPHIVDIPARAGFNTIAPPMSKVIGQPSSSANAVRVWSIVSNAARDGRWLYRWGNQIPGDASICYVFLHAYKYQYM